MRRNERLFWKRSSLGRIGERVLKRSARLLSFVVLVLTSTAFVVHVDAQSIPAPTNPVVFCGAQTPPPASTYQLLFDNGAPEALTMDATLDSACPAGSTHSFRLPASRFTVGNHTVQVRAVNTFGSTLGPVYTVQVGIAPGPFSITGVVVSGGQ
jgi:hypothetical protein